MPFTIQTKKIVKQGYWKYAGWYKKGVQIQAIDYDFWYEAEKAKGMDISDMEPNLNEKGEMYLILWMDASFTKRECLAIGTLELQSTMQKAEKTIGQKIRWFTSTNHSF